MEKKNDDVNLNLEEALDKRSKSSLFFSLHTADADLCKARIEELDFIIKKLSGKIKILQEKIDKMNAKLL